METYKNKKDSVFSGIFPSNEPAPPPAPAQQSYRPAAADDSVSALNKKIELMERNIIGQIEKKLAEQVSPPPPPPPAGLTPAVISKMTEMENRLKDFQEKFLFGAAQMKNIEESKISARREIEELLKVVREQQKYSEMDRAMHDQLEKAWLRVEELEKRMMEVYSSAAKKPAEPAAPVVSPAEIAAAVLKAVDTGLEARHAPLETALKNAVSKIEAGPAAARGIEGRVMELSAAIDARLAGFSSEIRQMHIDNFSGKERMEDMLTEVKKDVPSSVREAFADGSGVFLRQVDAAAIDGRERTDALAKLLISHLDELAARGRDNALKIDALESCVRSGAEKAISEASSMQRGLENAFRAHIDAAAVRAAAENSRQLEEIKEVYGLSSSNVSAISAMAENVSEIEIGLGGVLAGLKAFIKALEPVNIEALLGVSGAIIRRSFETVSGLVAGLEKETILLARAKGEIEANMKSLVLKSGGERK